MVRGENSLVQPTNMDDVDIASQPLITIFDQVAKRLFELK